jgi:hypothetical protein
LKGRKLQIPEDKKEKKEDRKMMTRTKEKKDIDAEAQVSGLGGNVRQQLLRCNLHVVALGLELILQADTFFRRCRV